MFSERKRKGTSGQRKAYLLIQNKHIPPTLSIFLQVIHTFHIRKIVVLIKKMYFCTNHESNNA